MHRAKCFLASVLPESLRLFAAAILIVDFTFPSFSVRAQENTQQPHEGDEIAVNLACGSATIAMVRDGVVIGALENPIEPNTRPPEIIPLGSQSAGVLFGTEDWHAFWPPALIASLGVELPRIRAQGAPTGPSLKAGNIGYGSRIEFIGRGLTERLRQLFSLFHGKLDVQEDEPVAELILLNFDPREGSEVWLLEYTLTQTQERGEYYQTSLKPPSYTQLWPPDKKQPKTLVGAQYPADDAAPTLLDLIQKNDPRLAGLSSDAANAAVKDAIVKGDIQKLKVTDATQFLRAALDAVASKSQRQEIAVIDATGFEWILPPPPPEKQSEEIKERPAGAPTLRKPPPGGPTLQKPPSQ
ncbi:MAG: hypothetical protein ACRD4K_07525 [Candidatus Acidiferrales bacterium]